MESEKKSLNFLDVIIVYIIISVGTYLIRPIINPVFAKYIYFLLLGLIPLVWTKYIRKSKIQFALQVKLSKIIPSCIVIAFILFVFFILLLPINLRSIINAQPKNPLLLLSIFIVPFTSNGIRIIFLAPIAEEIFYRGFLYKAIKNTLGLRVGIIISALFFTFMHTDYFNTNYLFILFSHFIVGVTLVLVFEKYKSLTPCIIVHSIIAFLSSLIPLYSKI